MHVRFPLPAMAFVLVPLCSMAQERGAAVGPEFKGTSQREETHGPTADVKTVVDLSRVKEGTLILELYAPATGRVLWRGVATELVALADETEARIDRMVGAPVQRYPPKS